ncbi:hypothetical protein, partial [Halorubrum tibetense]
SRRACERPTGASQPARDAGSVLISTDPARLGRREVRGGVVQCGGSVDRRDVRDHRLVGHL